MKNDIDDDENQFFLSFQTAVRAPVEVYSRYNQEKFVQRDEPDFRINIHASYHGLTLKSVTEAAAPNKLLVREKWIF